MASLVSRLLASVGLAKKPDESARRLALFQRRYADLRARYDAAVTDDDNRRHWKNADLLSAEAAHDPATRATLRARSRYEVQNNGYAAGIVRTRADDLVGTGPTLQITLEDDDESARAVEQAFGAWAKEIRLAEKLHTLDQARCTDGEAFAVLATNRRLANPVSLDVMPVEADRVADPSGGFFRFRDPAGPALDGIAYDQFGNPVSYTVLRRHPGDAAFGFTQEFDTYDTAFVVHWFRCDRPGQLRGVPELTSSLPLFAYLRRLTLATLAANETAANFAAMLETEGPFDSETTEPTPFATLEIERNMMTALPAGVKLNQLKAEHPNTMYPDFKWEILAECARPVRMPVNVAAGDTSRSNFSSAKIDHLAYRAGIRVDRAFCEAHVLERIYTAWAAEARTVDGLLPDNLDAGLLPRKWYWPGWTSWDKADAKQDTEMLNNGTTTLSELLAEWGQDWEDVARQRAKELALLAELGVPPPPSGGGGFGAELKPDLVERLHLNGNGHGGAN